MGQPGLGVEGSSKESVEWIWDHHFAAVAGDANAFELWPPRDERYRELLYFLRYFKFDNNAGRASRQSAFPLRHAHRRNV